MTPLRRLLLVAPLVVGLGAPAGLAQAPGEARSPGERAERARFDLDLAEEGRQTDATCGTKLSVRIDWRSFAGRYERKSVSAFCAAPLSALRSFCEGEHARAYIRSHARSFVCRWAPPGRTSLEPERGALRWNVDLDGANLEDLARAELLRKL